MGMARENVEAHANSFASLVRNGSQMARHHTRSSITPLLVYFRLVSQSVGLKRTAEGTARWNRLALDVH